MPTSRAGLLAILFVCAAPPSWAASADVVRFETNMSCVQFHAAEPVKQASLYGEAFTWTRHAALADWNFESVTVSSSGLLDNPLDVAVDPAAECVRVSYSAPVHMPAVLREYTSLGDFRTTVQKTTCAFRNVVLNRVFVHKLPFIGTVETHSAMRFESTRMFSVVHAQYTLPWYLDFMRHVSESIIVKSYSDELTATMEQLCTN